MKCWGANWFGQLALGDTKLRGTTANTLGNKLPLVNLGAGNSAKEVVALVADSGSNPRASLSPELQANATLTVASGAMPVFEFSILLRSK